MRRPPIRLAPVLLSVVAGAFLAACATPPPPPAASTVAPPQWYAPLPHDGQVVELSRWWGQFNDPLLTRLIDTGQQVSPTLAAAQSRLLQAQATRTVRGAALLPTLDASANAVRGRQDLTLPVGNSQSAGLQAGWEIDLFGGNRAARDAAQARLEGAQASWHEARVSVASEIAGTYVGLRACEAQVEQSQADATSRAESSRLTELAAKAGFQAPATAALARASAAQSNSLLVAQRAQCDLSVKALVALTGLEEPALRGELAAATARLPVPAQIGVQSVPGTVLGQRPDVYAAARDVVAASADVSQSQAARLPRITLAGSVGATRLQSGDTTVSGSTWAIGPLAVTLPLFDGGARRANVDAARARYDEAALVYRAKLRGAVREVEEALVQLQSTEARSADARVAAEGFEQSLNANEALYKNGAASLFQLEDARRSAVQARSALIDLQRERVTAWISLYRALGGGWDAPRNSDGPQARN
jgi:NodT family efflux transporter outer membrane factor (OMF) lipoprotein